MCFVDWERAYAGISQSLDAFVKSFIASFLLVQTSFPSGTVRSSRLLAALDCGGANASGSAGSRSIWWPALCE